MRGTAASGGSPDSETIGAPGAQIRCQGPFSSDWAMRDTTNKHVFTVRHLAKLRGQRRRPTSAPVRCPKAWKTGPYRLGGIRDTKSSPARAGGATVGTAAPAVHTKKKRKRPASSKRPGRPGIEKGCWPLWVSHMRSRTRLNESRVPSSSRWESRRTLCLGFSMNSSGSKVP